jgi:hypothetical protein
MLWPNEAATYDDYRVYTWHQRLAGATFSREQAAGENGATRKDQILAESYSGEMSVSAVARPHGLSPGQLFTWRRQVRKQTEPAVPPMFVPAVIDRAA